MLEAQYAEAQPESEAQPKFFGVNRYRMDALLAETQQLEQKASTAALRMMDDVYRQTLHKAELAMAAGATTLPKAIDMAVADFLRAGITCIEYKDGRRVNIADYTEMALRTAATRAKLQGDAAQRAELGVDTVLVSQYGGCSETCLPWQGRVYIDDVFGAFNGERSGDQGHSANGKWYPLLSVAVQNGLFHPNCRHTLSTWYEGVSTKPRPLDAAVVRNNAQLEQQQRALERKLRQAKRLEIGCTDPANAKKYTQRRKAAQKELREFVDAHPDVLRRAPWKEKAYVTAISDEKKDAIKKIGSGPVEKSIPERVSLETKMENYRSFLTSVPDEYKIYLEYGANNAEYIETDREGFVFGMSWRSGCLYYNPENPEFAAGNFGIMNTHELSHWVDYHFVRSDQSDEFIAAIKQAKKTVEDRHEDFIRYCEENDREGFLSDILSGFCQGEFIFPYRHSTDYWNDTPEAVPCETFANLFSLFAFNNKEQINFLKKNFPDVVAEFMKIKP